MRAKEFVINVPINIKINGDGDPEIDIAGNEVDEPQADDAPPAFISPQQQELELKKKELGKSSIAGAQLVDDPEEDELA